jgi:predicted nucleic acid-binding protein
MTADYFLDTNILIVVSEDMEHGQHYGGVTVINPFID